MNPTTSSALSLPPKQNTALVLEFRCLYTQDLRRKQKRWQDGKVKFHTFNKRVMVYDERSNFVGDTHWKGSEFNEGEELQLERGGFMVEVGECIGKRDQDLFELVDKRVKEREERVAAKNAQLSPSRPQASAPASGYLRPKTLNAVIGTPTGHYGRAMVTNLSPFEQKQPVNQDENIDDRPAKRRRQNGTLPSKNCYAQNLMGATLTLASTRPSSTATIRYEPLRPTIQHPQTNTIDLTMDEDEGSKLQRNDINKVGSSRKTPLRIQKSKLRRSPPAKGGYASNLTGATLSLGRRGDLKLKGDETKPSNKVWKEITSSSPERYFLAQEKGKRPETAPLIAQRSRLENTSCSSASEESKKVACLVSDDAVTHLIPERPVSTLRIKARAPRKMMMLMDLPSSRSSIPTASSVRRDSKHSMSPKVPDVEIPPKIKHAKSLSLEVGKQPSINRDMMSSSPIDSGIDHQTIDTLLSRTQLHGETEESITALRRGLRILPFGVGRGMKISSSNTPNEIKRTVEEDPNIQIPALVASTPIISSRIEHAEPPIESVRRDPPQLINPATQGQSIQSLAKKTVDAMAPIITNISSSPMPRDSDRRGRVHTRDNTGDKQSLGGPVAEGGPWSRESFDLFGSWRLPGRESTITS